MADPAHPSHSPSAAIVLAAGASTRLGHPKQLVRIDGESLLRRTTRLAIESGCSPVLVVLGFDAERMRPELAGLDAFPVIHPSWPEGMGSSLRCGMQALGQFVPPPPSVLILVCDQPQLSLQHLTRLLQTHQTGVAPIAASAYAGRTGVPAVFSASLFPSLLALSGDRGARDLIRRQSAPTHAIPWPDGEVDWDRPEDLSPAAQP